jgi:hypothetical protein
MIEHFRQRLAEGVSSPGLLVVSQGTPVGSAVESILTLWSVAEENELRDQIYHLPLLTRHVFSR